MKNVLNGKVVVITGASSGIGEAMARLCLMESEGRATHFVKKFAPGLLDRIFYWVMSKEPNSPFK